MISALQRNSIQTPSEIQSPETEPEKVSEVIKTTSVIFQPPAVSPLKQCSLKMENPYVSVGGEDLSQKDVFSELRVWREQHKR